MAKSARPACRSNDGQNQAGGLAGGLLRQKPGLFAVFANHLCFLRSNRSCAHSLIAIPTPAPFGLRVLGGGKTVGNLAAPG